MFKDRLSTFCDSLALPTSGTGWFNVGDVIDLQAVRDIARGMPNLHLVFIVMQAITSGGAATVQFALASDNQVPLRADGATEQIMIATQAIAKATLVAQYEAILKLPLDTLVSTVWSGTATAPLWMRYVGFQINVGTAALTAGSVSAFLCETPNAWRAYPSAVYWS